MENQKPMCVADYIIRVGYTSNFSIVLLSGINTFLLVRSMSLL